MADKDINIHVKAQDTEQTKTKVDGVGASVDQLGEKVKKTKQQTETASQKQQEFNEKLRQSKEEADKASKSQEDFGKKTKESQDEAGGTVDNTTKKIGILGQQLNSLKNYFLAAFGFTALINAGTRAIEAQSRAMKEHADISFQMQNNLLRLQFLGDFYKEKPELRKQVMEFAEFGRRPFEEVANAWYNLRSKSGTSLSPQMQEQIMKEALEYGLTDPAAPLDTLVDMFSLYAKQTKDPNANRIQNVIRETITQAGGSTAQTAQYMPQFLPIGMSGGLSGPEAAGIWAYITTQFAEPSIATTGLRSVFMALEGKGTPQSQQLLKKLGVKSDMNFFDKIQQLSKKQAEGKLDLSGAETIAQKEGAPALLLLLQNTEAMMKTVEAIMNAYQSDQDLTRNAIQELYGADELARLEDMSRFLDVFIRNVKSTDMKAVRVELGKKVQEAVLRKSGTGEIAIGITKFVDWITSGLFGTTLGGWTNLTDDEIYSLLNVYQEEQSKGTLNKQVMPSYLEPQPWEKPFAPAQSMPAQSPVIINNNTDNSLNIYPSIGEFEKNRSDFNE